MSGLAAVGGAVTQVNVHQMDFYPKALWVRYSAGQFVFWLAELAVGLEVGTNTSPVPVNDAPAAWTKVPVGFYGGRGSNGIYFPPTFTCRFNRRLNAGVTGTVYFETESIVTASINLDPTIPLGPQLSFPAPAADETGGQVVAAYRDRSRRGLLSRVFSRLSR